MIKFTSDNILQEGRGPNLNLLILPWRGGSPYSIYNAYKNSVSGLAMLIQPEPEWYPSPNGIDDQEDAVKGLRKTALRFEKYLTKLFKQLEITSDKVHVIGNSAGAVVGLKLLETMKFASMIIHSGAMLDPLTCITDTPILTIHYNSDCVFKWEERYLPMKKHLNKLKCNVHHIEKEGTNHNGITEIPKAIEFMLGKFPA